MGKFIRSRYDEFIRKNGGYNKKNIYVQSSEVKRCIDSAKHNLEGLFGLKKTLVKIHTIPLEQDHILAQQKTCPHFTQEMKKVKESMKPFHQNNTDYFKMLSYNSGMIVSGVCDVLDIYDNINVNVKHGNP